MVRFWLINKVTDDRVEAAYFAARLALCEQVAFEASLEKFTSLEESESTYWFEGALNQVARAVSVLGESFGLTSLGVEVSDRDLANKWPNQVRTGAIAVTADELPGRGERRLHDSRRQEARSTPEPNLESEMKRGFMPE